MRTVPPDSEVTHAHPGAVCASECIPPRYRGDDLSPAFASHLPRLMGRMTVWIPGHVHEPVTREVNGTRVIANPGGYPDEFDPPLFRPELVIEV